MGKVRAPPARPALLGWWGCGEIGNPARISPTSLQRETRGKLVPIYFFYRSQLPERVDPTPHNFNSFSRAEPKLSVLAFKIRILCQKLVIICATCAEVDLVVLAFKISSLRRKLFIICATRAEVNLGVLAFKISILRRKLVIICATRAEVDLGILAFKISILRRILVIICAT